MERFDQAPLRRFDLKVKSDYLSVKQVEKLLRYCASLALPAAEPTDFTRLVLLRRLTPGAFDTVGRQRGFRPLKWATMLVRALDMRCAVKNEMPTSAFLK